MNKAFTLIEVLIYTALSAVIGTLMVGILITFTQINVRESASAEVTSQLNFLTQTFGRLVRYSSNIEIAVGVSTSTIKLRMQDPAKDPTCISLVNGTIKLAEGPDQSNANNCNSITSDLTNTRVIANALNFKKFTYYPGHDTVSYDVQLTYNSQNPKAQVQRKLSSAIARVSAATFDSNLLPGSTDFEIGQTGASWKNLYLSGVLNLGTAVGDPSVAQNGSMYYNTTSNVFRGYKNSAWSNIGGDLWTASSTAIYYNAGNVGIGITNPSYGLDVSGTFRATATSTFSGNVGIGTSTPTAGKLVVNGTIDVSGNKITSVAAPTASTDAATKGYVDAASVVSYYQTSGLYTGATVGTACASGYHLCYPSEWVGRKYNTSLGPNPTLYIVSWYEIAYDSGSGGLNCLNWQSSTATDYGGSIRYSNQAETYWVWNHVTTACNNSLHVLCCSN